MLFFTFLCGVQVELTQVAISYLLICPRLKYHDVYIIVGYGLLLLQILLALLRKDIKTHFLEVLVAHTPFLRFYVLEIVLDELLRLFNRYVLFLIHRRPQLAVLSGALDAFLLALL